MVTANPTVQSTGTQPAVAPLAGADKVARMSVPKCSQCGAVETVVKDDETRCRFCNTLFPKSEAEVRAATLAELKEKGSGSSSKVFVAAGAVVVAVLVLWVATKKDAPPRVAAPAPIAVSPSAPPVASAAPPPPPDVGATLVRRFGGEGDGPGKLKSARWIAVDGDENVFVGGGTPSRVQQFDKEGKFVRLFPLSTELDCCVHGMAVDHAGHLYVSFHDDILRFKTADGSVLPKIEPPLPHGLNGQGFEVVAVDAFDMLYGLSLGGDGLVGTVMKYDKTGKLVERIPRKVPSGSPTLRGSRLAFDGAGKVFFAHRGGFIEVLDNKWALENRIGQEGSGPGDLPGIPGQVAWDGHGHLLTLGNSGIDYFDSGGRYRKSILDSKITKERIQDFQVGMNGNIYALTDKNEVAVFTPKSD